MINDALYMLQYKFYAPPPSKKNNDDVRTCIIRCRGKWGTVLTRGKIIFRSTGFGIQMTSFDK